MLRIKNLIILPVPCVVNVVLHNILTDKSDVNDDIVVDVATMLIWYIVAGTSPSSNNPFIIVLTYIHHDITTNIDCVFGSFYARSIDFILLYYNIHVQLS